jgi:uncharacterized RDD family membrane protein YckC
MTQHDDTGQPAGTDQALPSRPSPYLAAGESLPEAYLAPPQPGQPSFGSAPAATSPGVRFRGTAGQPYPPPGDGQQPGYGQPGHGQSGYRQTGNRPLRATQSWRDPAIATSGVRLGAATIDWIIIWLVSLAPFWSSVLLVAREYRAITANYQNLSSPAAQAALSHVVSDPAIQHVALYWSFALFGVALAYYWVQHAIWGATLGKRVVGVRVVNADDQGQISVRAAGIRTVTFLAGPAMLWLLASPLNVAGGVLWAADAGVALVDPRAQCLHDKAAGTIVIRQRWLDRQAHSARPW